MQTINSKILRIAIVLLGLMLAVGLFVAISGSQKASALDSTQWDTVRTAIDSYFSGQAAGGDEAGLIYGKLELMHNLGGDTGANAIDTDSDAYLGEGDDMANRPVLIDNLMGDPVVVPGTEFRCQWNLDASCFGQGSVEQVKALVDNHAAAGFSTDIIDYCHTSHTASPATAGFGIIAQVPGALASDGSVPKVYELWYSRHGWDNSYTNPADGGQAVGAPEAPVTPVGGFSPASNALDCGSSPTPQDLVRCTANWAISSTGGNVGNGQKDLGTIGGAEQSIDVRPGTITTLDTAGDNLQIPLDTLFSTSGLAQVDPDKSIIVASQTQHGGQAAMGLKMLGYNTVAKGFIHSGIARWSYATGGGLFTALGADLPLDSVSSILSLGPGVTVDTTAPSVTSIGAENVTCTSADIHRIAVEPATMKVEYGTTSGFYTDTVNDTVLNADKTVGLSDLTPNTTYFVKATSYDGYANGAVSTEFSFTTTCACGQPSITLSMSSVYWASMADYTARVLSVDYSLNNVGSDDAYNVALNTDSATGGVTPSNASYPVGTIAGSSSSSVTATYMVPIGVGSFAAMNSASADDQCGTGYTYP